MTIPSRPAPAPPGQRGLNAVAGVNASLEQLRQQLQQQQQEQQQQQQQQRLNLQKHQNGGVQQMLTIKLPPPPPSNSRTTHRGTPLLGNGLLQNNSNHINYNNNYSNNNINHNNNNLNKVNNGHHEPTSITRKFPAANIRYAPVTSWDGSPFESALAPIATTTTTTTTPTNNQNNNLKKMPPPRPPPPKVLLNHKKLNAPAPPQSVNILNNIFNRKKSTKAPSAPHKVGVRLTASTGVYGTNSGGVGVHMSSLSTSTTSTSISQVSNMSNTSSNRMNWGNSGNSGTYSTSLSSLSTSTMVSTSFTQQQQQQQETQLISFDSPPSSPTFTQKSNSDCVSVDSFSSDSNFSSPNNGSASQPESGFEDDFSHVARSRSTTSPLDPWETVDALTSSNSDGPYFASAVSTTIGTAPVRNLNSVNSRMHSSSSGDDNPLCNGKSLLPPASSLAKPTIIKPKISQKPKAPRPPPLANNLKRSNVPATPPSPPMPHCAPPPPPSSLEGGGVSLFDVISGKADALLLTQDGVRGAPEASEPPYGIALYNFNGVEDGDLNFRENETIYLLKQVSAEWYYGRTRSGCEGIFPANYIDIRIPLQTSTTSEAAQSHSASNCTGQITITTGQDDAIPNFEIPKVKCLYNFPAEVEGDLPLRENDLVTILYKINADWLFGEIDGRQGQFPGNFLEYIPANIPTL